jgi:hypothetical protein
MARIRSIKPEFFASEQVASVPHQWRLLFIGLWLHADREGRLLDRPVRLKAMLFPYDDLDVDAGLGCLVNAGLITRYEGNGLRLIAIPSWAKHQLPHAKEEPSRLPGPNGEIDVAGRYPDDKRRMAIYERDGFACQYCGRDMCDEVRARCVDHVVPISRGGSHDDDNLVTACKGCNGTKGNRLPTEAGLRWPESRGKRIEPNGDVINVNGPPTPMQLGREGKGADQEGKGTSQDALRARFDLFWAGYPRKQGKEAAWKEWLKRKPDEGLTRTMIAKVQEQRQSAQWAKDGGQYIPQPRTWLSQGRWMDEDAAPKLVERPDSRGHYPPCRTNTECLAKVLAS